MSDQVITTLEEKIGKSLQSLKNEMNTIRAGRANPALLDKVTVNYYGIETPLKQLANVSIPDARTLVVTPFDPKSIGDIEHGIQAANIGINPVNDGKLIRLVVPQVTEERRKELTKEVKSLGEEGKVAVRNLRKKAIDDLKKEEKEGELTEDELHLEQDEVQEHIDRAIADIDEMVAEKDKEIMEV